MAIKNKLIIGITLLAIFSTAVACFGVGALAIKAANDTVQEQAMEHLVSIRETKKVQIESYFKQINNQVLTLANDRMVIDAIKSFNQSIVNQSEVDNVAAKKGRLKQYYTKHFAEEYKSRNVDGAPNVNELLNKLDNIALNMQYYYIQKNPNPLGAKDALNKAQDGSEYSNFHDLYHSHFRDYLGLRI